METFLELGLTDHWQQILNSTQTALAIRRQQTLKGSYKKSFGRSRYGFTTKTHARADGQRRPLGFVLTGGEISDHLAIPDLLAMLANR